MMQKNKWKFEKSRQISVSGLFLESKLQNGGCKHNSCFQALRRRSWRCMLEWCSVLSLWNTYSPLLSLNNFTWHWSCTSVLAQCHPAAAPWSYQLRWQIENRVPLRWWGQQGAQWVPADLRLIATGSSFIYMPFLSEAEVQKRRR